MACSSGDSVTVQAASNLDLVAMRHVHASSGRRMLFQALESIGLFAHKLGMKLIAAKVLRLMSVDGPIELDAAKGIVLPSGGAFLEIKDGGIRTGGPAGWHGEFAGVAWSGPATRETLTRPLGRSAAKMDEFFRIYNRAGKPIAHRRYQITRVDGSVVEGLTDGEGNTQIVAGDVPETLKVRIFPPDPMPVAE